MTSVRTMRAAIEEKCCFGSGRTSRHYFCQLDQGGSSQTVSPFKHKRQILASGENAGVYPVPSRNPRQTRLAHSPNPLIFPKTNYPGVRDLTHKFRTAGEFSDFNHTSMPVPLNNLHCLSLAPALFQLCIDYYPASALCCDPAPPAVPLTLCPRGARKTASRSLGGREQSAGVMISS